MSAAPTFNRDRFLELAGRRAHPWVRRFGLTVMLAIVIVALTGALGQTERTDVAEGSAARLELRTPSTLRSGLLWRARVVVHARQKLAAPQLVLGSGYVDGMQLNTIEPAPIGETSRDGKLAFTFPTLDAGDNLTLYLQLQTDPTVYGKQDLSVGLESANSTPVRIQTSTRVLP